MPKPALGKTSVPPVAQSRLPGWLLAGLLGLVTLCLYWPVMRHNFVSYDDQVYVVSNVQVQAGLKWESITWAFSNPVSGNWHPLTMMSHMLDCQWFGLKPWGHHFTNVLLHAINTVLVFVFLRGLTGAFWRSGVVAAFFGWHPLHVESVAWVAERKDVLSGCLGLLTLIFYVRYARQQASAESSRTGKILPAGSRSARREYFLAWFCFALGLMSKPMLVTWPFVMLLLDYWPLDRFRPGRLWKRVREKIPFLVLSLLASIVTLLVQTGSGAVQSVESIPAGARFGNAVISYCRYLGKLFWPVNLAVFYPHPGSWPLVEVLLAGALLLGISVLFWRLRRRHPYLLMGWLWYAGTLVPVIGLVQAGEQAMADRYMYLPSLGLLVALVWGAYDFTRTRREQRVWLCVTAMAAIVACLAVTRHQIAYWQDGESLFRHALEVTPNNANARFNLGSALDQKRRFDEAIVCYREAVHLRPDYFEAHFNLAIDLDAHQRDAEAMQESEEAIRIRPKFALAHTYLGVSLSKLGRFDDAIAEYQEALRLNPDDPEAHNNLGVTLASQGRLDDAIAQYQEALRLNPAYAEARANLAQDLKAKNLRARRNP